MRKVNGWEQFGQRAMPRAQAVWRADEVPRAALAQKPAVFLAHHAAIHDPHALRLAVLFLHRAHHFLHGGHVGAVAREDFVGKRLPLGRVQTGPMQTCLQSGRESREPSGAR